MRHPDVIVIGGGIAGLATCWALARRGARVRLLEREPLLASHASGRNAAIFRQLEHDRASLELSRTSASLLASVDAEPAGLLHRSGALYVGEAQRLEALFELAASAQLEARPLGRSELVELSPPLAGGDAHSGLWVSGVGVLDVHAIAQALARTARVHGAEIATGSEVAAIEVAADRVIGVRLSSGEAIGAGAVVIASGAWATHVGRSAGVELAIEPRRRHLAALEPAEGEPRAGPIVWRLDEAAEVYFRPEVGVFLASPCDQEPWPAGEPPTAPMALEELARRLGRLAPVLAEVRVRRLWACLRSFCADGAPVAGSDPRVGGLVWLAGLGGRGMTIGIALGEVAAAAALGEPHPLLATLGPTRLLGL